MKLHTTSTEGLNLFTAYGDDHVAVNHEKYSENLIVTPGALFAGWSTASIETLQESDLKRLLELEVAVEVILLGTGRRLRFPPPGLIRPFSAAGIGLEVMDLQAACRTYNILASEGRKVAAALLFD